VDRCVVNFLSPLFGALFHSEYDMSMSPRVRNPNGRSNESSLVLLVAVAMVSFFAGTVLTAHVHLGTCNTDNNSSSNSISNNRHHSLNAQVEELAQKRLLGESINDDVGLAVA
jgi:hypothetical protein